MTLSGKACLAGVMGWPVEHSLSPRLHGYWLEKHRVDCAYVPFAVAPEELATALTALPALGLRGVNLTLPHKERALELCQWSIARGTLAIRGERAGNADRFPAVR